MAKVLVVGGAGYVGSSVCAWLLDRGHDVSILDDLSTGHRELVLAPRLVQARAGDRDRVLELLREGRFDCVMHFAACALVGESVSDPGKYFENNVEQTRSLVDAMLESGVRNFIFSSTCAVFGDPGGRDLNEDHPKAPTNPYGESKLEAEKMLAQAAQDRGLRAIALRYFNAAGTEPRLRVGEVHDPETHLIPNILRAALGLGELQVFGTDYPTPDGTCVRDYVHVSDLAAAHEAAMKRLLAGQDAGGSFEAFNLGSEKGFSVREILSAAEALVGRKVPVRFRERRPGDPPRLVAASARAKKELGFETMFSLKDILSTAWDWQRKRAEPRPAVFLDRDGTLNEDPGYLSDPSQMKLLPGVGDALSSLKQAGFLLVVVSNQSGVARGLIKPENMPRINARLDELLEAYGVRVDHYELCFHHPDRGCECRKPKPKLLLDAAAKLNVDLTRSYMVGDKRSDLGAGRAAGCRAVALVRTGEGADQKLAAGDADFVGADLSAVVRWVRART